MDNKIFYVCAICTKSAPPLISLNSERKDILAAVTSVLHLSEMFLLMCAECNQLLDAVLKFKEIAVTGVQNLLLLKERVKNSSKTIISKSNQKYVILQSKTEVKTNALPSVSTLKSIPEDATVTSNQETEAVDIKTEPEESPTLQYTDNYATSEDLTEEIHIKEEPEFETEDQLDFEIEPEESKPDIHDLIASNLYTEGNTANNNTDAIDNFESEVNSSDGTSNIQSKTDEFEGNIKIKSEPNFGESTDTCESDYGNEEDIILAALAKANAPTLPYLKEKDMESPSQSKTSKAKPSKKRRKTPAKKRMSEVKRKYYTWTETCMKMAMEAVGEKNTGLNYASRLYGVPKATLKRRLDGTNQKAKDAVQIVGSEGHFPPELEKELCEQLLETEKTSCVTPLDVRRLAFDLAEKHNIKHRFNKEERTAGKKWYYSFMKRHPQLSLRQPREPLP